MKKFFCVLIVFAFLNNTVVCYADSKEDLFIADSREISLNIKLNDLAVTAEGYIFHDYCYVDMINFIKILGYKYIETNYTKYDLGGTERKYFCEIYKNNATYYLFFENRISGSYYDVPIGNVYAEKSVNGQREEVYLSNWGASGFVNINGKNYYNISALVYLFDDMEYMTKIDMDNNEVVIKKYNRADYEKRVGEKYDVRAYSISNGMNEGYYKSLTTNEYDIYSGINSNNAREKCKSLLESTANISVQDINLKYDSSLDVYVVTAKGEVIDNGENFYFAEDFDKTNPKLIVRAFDGRVLYPY